MILNRVEYALMNNPVRAAIQRHFEARRLVEMGGALTGGAALEIGCGRGEGAKLILDVFRADSVDAFDLDPKMVGQARERLSGHSRRVRLWVGDATSIPVRDSAYDAVFDFGIIHHVPNWRFALTEVHRVLKLGGRFYAEEMLAPFILNPIVRCVLRHPEEDRFDSDAFDTALRRSGLHPTSSRSLGRSVAWFVAEKRAFQVAGARGAGRR